MSTQSDIEPLAGVTPAGARPSRRKGRDNRRFPLFLLPVLAFYLLFFGYPLLRIFWQSVTDMGGTFTLDAWVMLLEEPAYWKVLGYTGLLGVITLTITLIAGYTVAYWLVKLNKTWAVILMAFVLIPFWSSGLVRTYAWLVILGRQGVLNTFLTDFGLIDTPIAFIGTNTAVVFALAYYLLPYMILSIYSVMNGIDRNLLLAARNLGASPFRAFRHVFFPLTRPGILAGSYMVFMLGIGMYITPAMLGGPGQTTLPLVIAIQINEAMDWTFAAVLSVVLLLVTGLMQLGANRFLDFERLWGGAR
ncbi:ABC transporter permease [Maritimibacter alkaliphilus]|uniref:ABC transporter permease n=1 Tax=Maritimibacter alkaliphilus TaxID=404236 RepID=UPI001C986191|nr:ABC transporter permease [Maritimibacter alkaliphilus]MBY6090471.1 ABC transporter permease [Maritimibacter alkaliphilus]